MSPVRPVSKLHRKKTWVSRGTHPSSRMAIPDASRLKGSFTQEPPQSPSVVSEREMHVVASVEEWNRGLTSASLAVKFRMMGQSPIAFFTGTNHLFWADLSGDPHLTRFGNSQTTTWICGNCT